MGYTTISAYAINLLRAAG